MEIKRVGKLEKRYETIDGKEYVFIKCPFCGTELRFTLEPVGRRLYCQCKKCEHKLELTIE